MGGIADLITGGDKPRQAKKTQAQRQAELDQKNRQAEEESEIAAAEALRKKRVSGRQSLLTGSAQGVKSNTTGGAGNPNA